MKIKPQFFFGVFLMLLVFNFIYAQDTGNLTLKNAEMKKWYTMNTSEIIFAGGKLVTKDFFVDGMPFQQTPENVIRFTAFFHFQQQFHFNFNNKFGIYTGTGIRNVGFINTFSGPEEKIKVKQRCYSFGIPLALKAGDMNSYYFAAGAEAELMFAYKCKVFYDGDKSKKSQWFSDDIHLFNPSVFAEFHFKGGSYLRAKYYLADFLKSETETFVLPDDGRLVSYKVESSRLFYFSIGTSIKSKKMKIRKTSSTSNRI